MAFQGIDIRQTGDRIVFRAYLTDSNGAILATGTTNLRLYEVQSDGTIKSYDFNDNTFKTTALTTQNQAMTHRAGNNGSTNTGLWTYALTTLSGFTAGSLIIAQVTNTGASPATQSREFQFGVSSAFNPFDGVRGGMTALPNAAANAAGGLPVSIAGSLDLDARLDAAVSSRASAAALATVQADTDDIQTRLPAALVSGRMDASVGAMAADTLTAAALATDAREEIADAVWDEALSGHQTGGTAGKALKKAEDFIAREGTCQAGSTASTIVLDAGASAVTDYYLPGLVAITGGTGAGQFRRISAYNGTTKTATVATNWATTPDGTSTFSIFPWASVRVSDIDNDVITAAAIATDAIGSAEFAQAAADKVWSSTTRTVSAATNITSTGGTTVPQTGDSFARLGLPAGASVSADVAAVKSDTGTLLARITSTLFTGITSLAEWLGLLGGKQSGNATARTELRATGAGSGTFDETTDSLEAIRDRGDAAWTTGGASLTDILNIIPLVPESIDLANTATWRLGLMLTNAVDDLPSTAEITPGTIDIDRKAIGGTSWTSVVSAQACSEDNGLVYFDEVFDTGTGYAEGDSIRITFKSQKITVAANDYEISDATGRIFYTEIRQTMRGTNNAFLAASAPANFSSLGIEADGMVHADLKEWKGTAPLDLTSQLVQSQANQLGTQAKADVNTEVDNALDTAVPGSPTANSINERVKTMDDANIPGRLPTSLVSGRMDSSVGAVAAGAIGAAAFAAGAIDANALASDAVTEIRSLVSGTSDSGTTTTMVDAARTEADTDYWKGCWILFTSGTIANQVRLITGFNPTTDTITFTPATTQAVATQNYEILPAGAIDIRLWKGVAPNDLISGDVTATLDGETVALSTTTEAQIDAIEVDTNEIQTKLPTNNIMGSAVKTDKDDEIDAIKTKTDQLNFTGTDVKATLDGETVTPAAGSITSTVIAANAVGASQLATDAVNEIRDAILSDSTPFAGADIAVIKKLAEADWVIDKTTNPAAWRIKIQERGTATVLLTKLLKDVDGSDIASTTTPLGQMVQ